MAKKDKEAVRLNRADDESIVSCEEEPEGFFDRLFNTGTIETDASGDEYGSDFDGSADSQTIFTDATGRSEDSDEISEETSKTALAIFDKGLRAKHRNACKNMTVGKYARAIKIFESILSELLERYGEEHRRVGSALHNVAVANLRSGLLDDARDAIEEAVRIRKLTLGEDEPQVADSLVEYGIILLSMKKYRKSITVFEDALELRELELSDATDEEAKREAKLKKAKILHNIGCVNFEIKDFDQAWRNYMEAIKQQKQIFAPTWKTAFGLLENNSKPGRLTMASTICNKGYIEVEQDKYSDAIRTFNESLKFQKTLLEADNKLILSTMTNIAYCHIKLQQTVQAAALYKELVKLQSESYTATSKRGWSLSLKKLIYCQVVLFEFEDAFDNLRQLEEYMTNSRSKSKNNVQELRRTHELMGEINYQIFKFPTLSDYTSRLSCTNGCGCNDDRKDVNVKNWIPKKPINGSKMSGHRMAYA
mmetsp:Transcript_26880/g.63147  ORF Transcript_26880/g.63147 Transcript_26880/m.63147 type:complete len:479 (+) Transcript_26880:339-1775(+)|eukprot:CAMPEP_0197194044 /NCGR_PEP_ID=MMETSP1423-20130617/28560_1 /TAXON_ID=476441 /ORGANISM="Pseudo-nitzschia heimii, Strain UNC1101" /LENGTH=478 /DNA_ID=CAMNT_0042647405 /DNA_START=313 /DNA_END=1749 /DNA_ORIENTATION=-